MTESQDLWLAKLAAWTHDPAEKALVLLRDPAGHEGGTVRALRAVLFPAGVPAELQDHVERADHWASAADRPQFPRSASDGRYAAWTQVRFDEQPVLIHPLSGEEYDLRDLGDIDAAHIRAASTGHFLGLVERDGAGRPDARKTALAFWRFGPEIEGEGLRLLWQLLPADTRIPDHTIWTHLDLSAAFATAFAADAALTPSPSPGGRGEPAGNAALLAVSFGPVQDFIAAARTSSDLWAGSHLLSSIAWAGLKVICEELGPDAVLFPQLRGVPQVDLWLRNEAGLAAHRFATCGWATQKTDANPLFAAALPNKFVALVPAGRARELAQAASAAMRVFVADTARAMLADVLARAGIADTPELPCHAQLAAQLEGFPEVHWAAVPFAPLVQERGEDAPDTSGLARAGAPFGLDGAAGFLGSAAWKRLSRPLDLESARFYRPNPGALYPAVYELLDRLAAAAKSVRVAPQRPEDGEEGYRCDLTGEAEWLTHDRRHLLIPKGERRNVDTLWKLAAGNDPGLTRKGEHLSALAMLKRLWPRWFVGRELEGLGIDTRRFVVSTHTLAIATSLERWLDGGAAFGGGGAALLARAEEGDVAPAALPRKLALKLWDHDADTRRLARVLPSLLEKDAGDDPEVVSDTAREVSRLLGDKPETYYALILLDGDRMGAWLSGSEADFHVPTLRTFHPQIRETVANRFGEGPLADYLAAPRAVSPARHMAISGALNGFALHLAQHVVEECCKGKLLYAGGDDVLALVAVDDLLACLTLLRAAYAGLPLADDLRAALGADLCGLRLGGGHAELEGRLLRLMGGKASASAGAVIAHHQAPLGAVLRSLRQAEKRAKSEGGRDAFAISLMKRAGGATHLTLPWRAPGKTGLEGSPMAVLAGFRNVFSGEQGASRKAAYLTQGWLPHLPAGMAPEELERLLAASLGYQLQRQRAPKEIAEPLAGKLAALAVRLAGEDNRIAPAATLRDVLAVAEFLAREGRA